jgi:hypothetical protein
MNGNHMFQFLRLRACPKSNSLPVRKNALVMLRLSWNVNVSCGTASFLVAVDVN